MDIRNDLTHKNYIITGENGYVGNILRKYFTNISTIHNNKFNKDIILLHLASSIDKNRIIESNITYLEDVVKYCIKNKIKKFVYFSTVCVYGKQNQLDIDERNGYMDLSLYGSSKLFAEQYLKSIKELDILVLRLPAILTQKMDTFIARILENLNNNKDIILTNYDNYFNNFISVEDIAKFVKQYKFEVDYEVINFASNKEQTLKDIVIYLKKILNSKSKIIYSDTSSNYYNISIDKLKNKYSFTPTSYKKSLKGWVALQSEK